MTVNKIWGVAGLLLGFYGLGIVGWQILSWLQTGMWVSYSALNIVALVGGKAAAWADFPTSWVGLHAVLGFIPASLVAVFVGFFGGGALLVDAE